MWPVEEWLRIGEGEHWPGFVYALVGDGNVLNLSDDQNMGEIKDPITTEEGMVQLAKTIRFEEARIPAERKNDYLSGNNCLLIELEKLEGGYPA